MPAGAEDVAADSAQDDEVGSSQAAEEVVSQAADAAGSSHEDVAAGSSQSVEDVTAFGSHDSDDQAFGSQAAEVVAALGSQEVAGVAAFGSQDMANRSLDLVAGVLLGWACIARQESVLYSHDFRAGVRASSVRTIDVAPFKVAKTPRARYGYVVGWSWPAVAWTARHA